MSEDPPPPGYWETSKSDLGGPQPQQPQPGGGPPGDLLGCFYIKRFRDPKLGSSQDMKLYAKIFLLRAPVLEIVSVATVAGGPKTFGRTQKLEDQKI